MRFGTKLPLIASAILLAGSVGFAADSSQSKIGTQKTSPQNAPAHGDVDASKSGSTMADQSMSQGSSAHRMARAQRGHNYDVIQFKKGTAQLTDSAKKSLRTLVQNAKEKGEIEKLHVAVWSDKSFPKGENAELSDTDQKLAEQRIESIQNYVKDTLKVDNVDTYNMAEKTNWFSRAMNTQDAELKSLFSQQGAPANISEQEFKIVKQHGGPSKAVILLMHERQSKSGSSHSGESSK